MSRATSQRASSGKVEGLKADRRIARDSGAVGSRSPQGRQPRLVSVVIPALNAAEHLAGQLRALSLQDYAEPWEVVVADNGSSDSTVTVAEGWADRLPELRALDASQERGAAFARNAGAYAARGDLLAFCDADDVVDAAWLSKLSTVALSSDIVGGGFSVDNVPNYLGFLPYARTGSMAVWRNVFEDLGGFDAKYLGGEDVDFSWRAQLSGYSLGFAEDARIQRGLRTTLRESVRQAYSYGSWEAILIRNYRDRGLQTTVWARTARNSGWLAIRIPYLLMSGSRRLLWLRIAARLLGSVIASLRHKVHPRWT